MGKNLAARSVRLLPSASRCVKKKSLQNRVKELEASPTTLSCAVTLAAAVHWFERLVISPFEFFKK